jgi:hypothetical protein
MRTERTAFLTYFAALTLVLASGCKRHHRSVIAHHPSGSDGAEAGEGGVGASGGALSRAGSSGVATGGTATSEDAGQGGNGATGGTTSSGGSANAGGASNLGGSTPSGGATNIGGSSSLAGRGGRGTGGVVAMAAHHRLDAGQAHTCLLRDDGTISCWGYDTFELSTFAPATKLSEPPAGKFAWLSVGSTSCAFDSAGAPTCWSVFPLFQPPNKPLLDYASGDQGSECSLPFNGVPDCPGFVDGTFTVAVPAIAVSASSYDFACALNAQGTTYCSPRGTSALAITPPATPFSSVVTGLAHACGLALDGHVECWGDDKSGQTDAPNGEFSELAADGNSTCGLHTDGTVNCWGATTDAPDGKFSEVTVGTQPNDAGPLDHACALREDGKVACWGGPSGRSFQAFPPADIAVAPEQYSAFQVGSTVVNDVSTTGDNVPIACAIDADKKLSCFRNGPFPLAVPDGTFAQVAVGAMRACAIRDDDHSLACFDSAALPVPSGSFSQVSVGEAEACAVETSGRAYCWDLATGTLTASPNGAFSQVAVDPSGYATLGVSVACGIVNDGGLHCWDQLGEADLVGPFSSLSASYIDEQFYALRPNGSISGFIEAYGDDSSLELEVSDMSQWAVGYVKIADMERAVCALSQDGSLLSLGIYPQIITTLSNGDTFVDLTAGRDYCCGLKADGTVRCYGNIVH